MTVGRGVPWRTLRALSALSFVAVVFYTVSPYVALWRVSNALRCHDVAALRSTIDWNRVRAGLKAELTGTEGSVATVKQASASASAQSDDLPEFGDSFAKNAISNVVDEDCDPEHVGAMLGHGPSHGPSTLAAARRMLAWAFFTGPETFQALVRVSDDPHAEPVRVKMMFSAHGWRVTDVWLPEAMLDAPAEANAT